MSVVHYFIRDSEAIFIFQNIKTLALNFTGIHFLMRKNWVWTKMILKFPFVFHWLISGIVVLADLSPHYVLYPPFIFLLPCLSLLVIVVLIDWLIDWLKSSSCHSILIDLALFLYILRPSIAHLQKYSSLDTLSITLFLWSRTSVLLVPIFHSFIYLFIQ